MRSLIKQKLYDFTTVQRRFRQKTRLSVRQLVMLPNAKSAIAVASPILEEAPVAIAKSAQIV